MNQTINLNPSYRHKSFSIISYPFILRNTIEHIRSVIDIFPAYVLKDAQQFSDWKVVPGPTCTGNKSIA